MTTLSGGMTGGGVITRGKVTPSGPVMVGVGVAGVEGAIGGASTGGWGGGLGAVWASRDRAAAYRERIGRNLIKTMISRGGKRQARQRRSWSLWNAAGASRVHRRGSGRGRIRPRAARR